MSEVDLKKYLKERRIWHNFITKQETIHTADAAKVAGVELSRLTKNLVSKTEHGEYVLLIVSGNKKVDLSAAAKALSVRNIQLVPFALAEEISGYPPGGTPSIGHKTRMRTVIDETLQKYKTVYCGGGSRDKIVEIQTNDIIKLNNAIIANIIG